MRWLRKAIGWPVPQQPKPHTESVASEPEQFATFDQLTPVERRLIEANERRITIVQLLGLDIALRRDGGTPEYLMPGEQPTASAGFVVVRNYHS